MGTILVVVPYWIKGKESKMDRLERELIRDIRAVFANADRAIVEETQKAYVIRGAWLQAWALETLL